MKEVKEKRKNKLVLADQFSNEKIASRMCQEYLLKNKHFR